MVIVSHLFSFFVKNVLGAGVIHRITPAPLLGCLSPDSPLSYLGIKLFFKASGKQVIELFHGIFFMV